jgi:hypothetical protein
MLLRLALAACWAARRSRGWRNCSTIGPRRERRPRSSLRRSGAAIAPRRGWGCGERLTVLPFSDGGVAGDSDATAPPGPDGSLDARDETYDGSFFPDALCGAATCHNGCCTDLGECIDPPTSAACGGLGEPCRVCDAGPCGGTAGCVAVQETCGPANCGGCCVGNQSFGDAAQTQCMPGTDGVFCGFAGSGCTTCGPGQTCRAFGFDAGGFCETNNACDPNSCTGCCIGNICAQGSQAIACGVGGVSCKACGDGGICTNGNCECGGPQAPPCSDGG